MEVIVPVRLILGQYLHNEGRLHGCFGPSGARLHPHYPTISWKQVIVRSHNVLCTYVFMEVDGMVFPNIKTHMMVLYVKVR